MQTVLSYIWLPVVCLIVGVLLAFTELATEKGIMIIVGIGVLAVIGILVLFSRGIAKDNHWFGL